jgi:hypothetical protein
MKKIILLSITLITLSLSREIPSDNKIQGRLNIINGASSECVMHKFYTQSSWIQIEGEIGRNGIDGLYYKLNKRDKIKEVLVAESKWNTSKLSKSGKNKTIKQMSQKWVLKTMDKLIKKNPNMPYHTLKQFIEQNQYRARLFKLKPTSNNSIQISIYKIKNKGENAFDKIQDTKLEPININKPKNSFETMIVDSYNHCRTKYLNKYFPTITENEIKELLTDNYLQKKDIKKVFSTNQGKK